MDDAWLVFLTALCSYLIGSISMTRLVVRIARPGATLDDISFVDKKTSKSYRLRTISATTASMKLGPRVGGMIALLDTIKGAVPVLAARLIFPDLNYHLIAGLSVVAGHNWSIFNRFTGGAGFSAANGVFLAVNLVGALVSAMLGMSLGFLVLQDMFLAFLLVPWLMLLWLIIFAGDFPHIIFGIAINLVILLKLAPEIYTILKNKAMKDVDFSGIMDQTAVGRFWKRLMKSLGIRPKNKEDGKQ